MSGKPFLKWGDVEVYRKGNTFLLIREYYPCPHRDEVGNYSQHVHYYIITLPDGDVKNELRNLIDWLNYGFWWDSFLPSCMESVKIIVKRFFENKCMGNTHFLGE